MASSSSSSSFSSSEEDELICQAVQTTIKFLIDQRHPRALLFRQPRLRDRKTANETLIRHYFSPDPAYGVESFKTRFRMTRRLFMRLANDLPEHFEYFQQRDDARGHPGFTPTQKITAALRQLAYGVGSDMLDEYLQMAKKTGRNSLNHFCKDGVEPPQAFFANGEHFKYGYYLVDGIYSEWGTLVQAYASPLSDKRKYFTKRQESARKDIERAFGVLKKKWALLANPIKF
ncbi:uncharacterized protein LOC143544237 [Bidens hawaiensis]|uniref:uncharacterized protein LOC143544237 n=1 Tax=Bidens hawaiensis TaxID=980011 RepID=UPI00404A2043